MTGARRARGSKLEDSGEDTKSTLARASRRVGRGRDETFWYKVRVQGLPKVEGLYAILNLPYPKDLGAVAALEAMIRGQARWVQLRAKDMGPAQRGEVAALLRPICRQAGVGFAVNDDLATAIAVGADLVHVGQEDLAADPDLPKRARDAGIAVGISTHNLEQFRAAQQRGGFEYVAIGPIFGTRTKANPDAQVGLAQLAQCMAGATLPVVAIGGISPDHAPQLWALGVDAVAVISAIEGESQAQVESRCRAFEASRPLR